MRICSKVGQRARMVQKMRRHGVVVERVSCRSLRDGFYAAVVDRHGRGMCEYGYTPQEAVLNALSRLFYDVTNQPDRRYKD